MTTTPVAILGTWVLVLPALVLLGLPIAALVARRGPDLVRTAMWSGLAVFVALAVAANQAWPARSPQTLAVLVAVTVLAALALLSRRVRARLARGWHRLPWWAWLTAAIAVGVLSVGSALTPTHYDFGLYHWAGIRWAADYAAVPGLGNLISYLGYANSETSAAAVLMNGPAGDFGFQALNGLLALVLLADLLLRFIARRRGAGTYAAAVTTAVVWVPLLVFADLFVASPTSDTAVFILTAAALVGLTDLVGGGRVRGGPILLTLLPLLVATTMRPQALAVAGIAAAVIVVVGARGGWGRAAGRASIVVGIAWAALGALMVARDYVLTGRAVFPLSLWTWDVPWLVDDPSELRRITIAIARDPSPTYQEASHGYAWLPGWLMAQAHQWEALAAALLAVLGIVAALWARGRGPLHLRRLGLLVAPGVVYGLAWVLVLPPTWRHAYGAVLGTLAVTLGWLLHAGRAPLRRLLAVSLGSVAVVALGSLTLRYPAKADPFPEVAATSQTLPSGLAILRPTGTDQCWTNDLLCSPIAPETLRLLGDDLGAGFAVRPPR